MTSSDWFNNFAARFSDNEKRFLVVLAGIVALFVVALIILALRKNACVSRNKKIVSCGRGTHPNFFETYCVPCTSKRCGDTTYELNFQCIPKPR